MASRSLSRRSPFCLWVESELYLRCTTAGLPVHRLTEDATTVTLEIEYLRNTVSGLLYTPQFSTSLEPGSFQPMTGPETIVPVDACWERVVASQIFDRATNLRCFATVQVQLP